MKVLTTTQEYEFYSRCLYVCSAQREVIIITVSTDGEIRKIDELGEVILKVF